MDILLAFIAGLLIGGNITVFILAALTVSKNNDEST